MNQNRVPRWIRLVSPGIAALVAMLFVATPATLAQPLPAVSAGPALTVNAAAGNYPINPDIYGLNFAADSQLNDVGIPVNRWGGNAVSRYNYQTNISNHAMDWYYENILEGSSTGLPDNSAANEFINAGNAAGAKSLITVPTIGYVSNNNASACGFSKLKYGNQQFNDWQWRPDCYNGVKPNGQYVTGNDPLDTSIVETPAFVGGWVTYLNTKYGTAAPRYYALDNEPDLWFETHRDVHPAGAGYDEMYTRGRDYSLAIKGADPSAKVFGPVSWGWWGYFASSEDVANNPDTWWTSNALQPDKYVDHGGQDFVPWYLAQMKTYSDTHSGMRLLDYLDLHFYTQVPGVSLSGSAGLATRMRSTRSLWDPTYNELNDGSWIDQPVMLIPRMHTWVDTYYPGTKLAITEYNWGALDRIDGALAQADVLGIFGRERVDLATLWGPPEPGQPGEYAFRMYLNYDGAGGHFGDTAVQSTSADQSKLAIYGSKDSGSGDLKLMVINKTTGALSSTIGLSGFTPEGCLTTYTYSPANLNAIVNGWGSVSGSSLTREFPAQSITLLVIPTDGSACTTPHSALPAPALNAPKAGAVVTAASTKLTWKKVKTATSYNLEVTDDEGNPVFSGPVNATSYTLPLGYGRYHWRVQALAADGLTDFSAERAFDVTRLSSPKDGASVKVSKIIFKWKTVKNATYHLTVWKDKGLPTESVVINQPVTGSSFKPLPPLVAGNYTWTLSVNGVAMPEWDVTGLP